MISLEHAQLLALTLLPYLFKKTAKQTSRSKCKSNWFPEHEEVVKCFIYHFKVNDYKLLKAYSKKNF